MRKLYYLLNTFSFIFFIGLISCSSVKPPRDFVESHDESNIWKNIEIRDGLDKDELWRIVVDATSQQFDLEVLDKEAGYMRSSWKFSSIGAGERRDSYANRISIKFVGTDWKTLQLKCEAEWNHPKEGWIMGYDTRFLKDVFSQLQGRVGRLSK